MSEADINAVSKDAKPMTPFESLCEKLNSVKKEAMDTRVISALLIGSAALGGATQTDQFLNYDTPVISKVFLGLSFVPAAAFGVERALKSIQLGQQAAALEAVHQQHLLNLETNAQYLESQTRSFNLPS